MTATEDVKNLSVTLARVDTRIESILENQEKYSENLEAMLDELSAIGNRVLALEIKVDRSSSLEAKVETLAKEMRELQLKDKWITSGFGRIVVFILQVSGLVLGSAILAKLGIPVIGG